MIVIIIVSNRTLPTTLISPPDIRTVFRAFFQGEFLRFYLSFVFSDFYYYYLIDNLIKYILKYHFYELRWLNKILNGAGDTLTIDWYK